MGIFEFKFQLIEVPLRALNRSHQGVTSRSATATTEHCVPRATHLGSPVASFLGADPMAQGKRPILAGFGPRLGFVR